MINCMIRRYHHVSALNNFFPVILKVLIYTYAKGKIKCKRASTHAHTLLSFSLLAGKFRAQNAWMSQVSRMHVAIAFQAYLFLLFSCKNCFLPKLDNQVINFDLSYIPMSATKCMSSLLLNLWQNANSAVLTSLKIH